MNISKKLVAVLLATAMLTSSVVFTASVSAVEGDTTTTVTWNTSGAFTVDGARFVPSSDGTQVAYNGSTDLDMQTIRIPSAVCYGGKLYKVTRVNYVYYPYTSASQKYTAYVNAKKAVTKVIVPATVTTFGSASFAHLTNASGVTIAFDGASTLSTIEEKAFKGSIIKSLKLPSSYTVATKGAFNGGTFYDFSFDSLVTLNADSMIDATFKKQLVIPATCATVANKAFNSAKIATLTLKAPGTGVTQSLKDEAFNGVKSIDALRLGNPNARFTRKYIPAATVLSCNVDSWYFTNAFNFTSGKDKLNSTNVDAYIGATSGKITINLSSSIPYIGKSITPRMVSSATDFGLVFKNDYGTTTVPLSSYIVKNSFDVSIASQVEDSTSVSDVGDKMTVTLTPKTDSTAGPLKTTKTMLVDATVSKLDLSQTTMSVPDITLKDYTSVATPTPTVTINGWTVSKKLYTTSYINNKGYVVAEDTNKKSTRIYPTATISAASDNEKVTGTNSADFNTYMSLKYATVKVDGKEVTSDYFVEYVAGKTYEPSKVTVAVKKWKAKQKSDGTYDKDADGNYIVVAFDSTVSTKNYTTACSVTSPSFDFDDNGSATPTSNGSVTLKITAKSNATDIRGDVSKTWTIKAVD